MIDRHLFKWAFHELNDLRSPMLFLSGPRQVGKTFCTKMLPNTDYYNWDTTEVRKAFAQNPYFFRSQKPLIVFDEIHKRKDWKKLLKGYYDSPARSENFIVTGSGRLDLFQKGGDSLQGRYANAHLYPLMFDEVLGFKNLRDEMSWKHWEPSNSQINDLDLLELGGFPAPFLKGSKKWLQSWQDQYITRLTREDVRDVSKIEKLDQLDLLARILPERVSAPVSYESLSTDIEVSPLVIKNWIRLFETLYFGFLIKPYHYKIHRSVKKIPKWYFYQWTFCKTPQAVFENYIATQLLAHCQAWRDQGLGVWELNYLRDQDKREVDFILLKDRKPQVLIEAKSSEQPWPSSLHFYCEKLNIPGILVYPKGKTLRVGKDKWSCNSAALLRGLLGS